MKITLRYWKRTIPAYTVSYDFVVTGSTAAECMREVHNFRMKHDLAKFTPAEIINVED